ncbi:aminodeoxychorismate synthase component I [Ferrimonas gelatinilytica]|uniref:aminodeoxychorismate synthase n=1 Tax=Ferrimonas gelatinilytica TaxID=1255257 RepID=A0ABP9RVS4_9GAMM
MALICRTVTPAQLGYPTETPTCALALFAPLAQRPWAMLLDSACHDDTRHPDARFDILVADPMATLTTRGSHTQCQIRSEAPTLSDADPLALLEQLQRRLLGPKDAYSAARATGLPFTGGALGHFSYDLGRRFERLPSEAEDDIDLAQMAVGIFDWALMLDHQRQRLFLLVRGDEAAWLRRRNWLRDHVSPEQKTRQIEPFALTTPWQHQLSQAAYRDRFERVQAYLRSGDCYQINLTQRFSAGYRGDEWQAYQRLRTKNQAPFSAFIRLPDAALLSLSPERFLQVRGSSIQTKPIKGTRPRHQDPLKDRAAKAALKNAQKDRAENLMIVDLLRNDLGKMAAPGSVRVPSLFAVESFPAVHHLVSTVTATLAPNRSALDLLRGAFPGGSITGAPKIRAMEIIEELEPARRSLYCGSIGYLSQDGQMDTSITIRSLVARQGAIHCWAGGGIVADSDCDEEYQECFDKISRILPLLESPTT